MNHLNWYWEIKHNNSGPDYHLSLTFNIDAAAFDQWTEDLLSINYTSRKGSNSSVWSNNNSTNTTCVNVYRYPDATIAIELVWGIEHKEADELLQQLLSSPHSDKLVQWEVSAGGQGYSNKTFGQGINATSFFEYCQRSAPQ